MAVEEVSVVVVSYNVVGELRRCLRSLSRDFEVIVVDNASCDGSQAMLKREFPHVTLIERSSNAGFAVAVNQGASRASGSALLVLNPDTELPPGAAECMRKALANHPTVWAMGFRQVDETGFYQLSVGPTTNLAAEFLRKLVQQQLDRRRRLAARLLDRFLSRPTPVPWVSGSALLVRREAFARVGGFDERFFLFFEDIDFCLRLGQAGGSVIFDPGLTLVHRRGASAVRAPELAAKAYRDSQLLFWRLHRSGWEHRAVKWYLAMRGLAPS